MSSLFLTVVFTHTRIHTVACRLSPQVPSILGKFLTSTGINLRGSMRPRQKRREERWRRRVSFTVAVYRTTFLFLLRIFCDDGCCLQISQYVPVQLWGPILFSSHLPVDLTNPRSSSITTHYYKISGIIGVSSVCFPFRAIILPFDLVQAGRAFPL